LKHPFKILYDEISIACVLKENLAWKAAFTANSILSPGIPIGPMVAGPWGLKAVRSPVWLSGKIQMGWIVLNSKKRK
jgi:hypothetical protein